MVYWFVRRQKVPLLNKMRWYVVATMWLSKIVWYAGCICCCARLIMIVLLKFVLRFWVKRGRGGG